MYTAQCQCLPVPASTRATRANSRLRRNPKIPATASAITATSADTPALALPTASLPAPTAPTAPTASTAEPLSGTYRTADIPSGKLVLLPPELLAVILRLVSGIAEIEALHRLTHSRYHAAPLQRMKALIKARSIVPTHVCRLWRQLLLAHTHRYAVFDCDADNRAMDPDCAAENLVAMPEHTMHIRHIVAEIHDESHVFRCLVRSLFFLPHSIRDNIRWIGIHMGANAAMSQSEFGAISDAFPNIQSVFFSSARLNTKMTDILTAVVSLDQRPLVPVSMLTLSCIEFADSRVPLLLIHRAADTLEYLDLGTASLSFLSRLLWPSSTQIAFRKLRQMHFHLCRVLSPLVFRGPAGNAFLFPLLERLCYTVPVIKTQLATDETSVFYSNMHAFLGRLVCHPLLRLRSLTASGISDIGVLGAGSPLPMLASLSLTGSTAISQTIVENNSKLSETINTMVSTIPHLKHLCCLPLAQSLPSHTPLTLDFDNCSALRILNLKPWAISMLDLNNLIDKFPCLTDLSATLTKPDIYVCRENHSINLSIRNLWLDSINGADSVWNKQTLDSLLYMILDMVGMERLLLFSKAFSRLQLLIARSKDLDMYGMVQKAEQTLAEQLEALGSALKSQIMTDLNSWEERKRTEQQQQQQQHGGRNKKYAHKRARPQPLPEIAHDILVDIRKVRHLLYTRGAEVMQEISSWAIGVLSVFVSVADMKGNCKLADLISLPGTKAAFQLLLLAVESDFPRIGIEGAEMRLIHTVVSTTKDPRAVGWVLNQYGSFHRASFAKCLHLYCISQIPRISTANHTGSGNVAAAAEAPVLTQAISDLSSMFADENAQALIDVLDMYRQVVSTYKTDPRPVNDITRDDPRRFVLSYLIQLPLGRKLLLLDGSEDSVNAPAAKDTNSGWLADAIKFEMQMEFSSFLVPSEDSAESLQPLKRSIEVLFNDTAKIKKISDQSLDIQRSLGVFFLANSVVRGSNSLSKAKEDEEEEKAVAVDFDEDVEMQSISAGTMDDQDWCRMFIDGCRDTLQRLVSREQELVILSQLPKMVKNMPQPIPNGLQETVQRGGRIYNNGSIAMPTVNQGDGELMCKTLFRLIASAGEAAQADDDKDAADVPASRLFRVICEMAPLLVEILAMRIDSPAMVKLLFRELLEGWPIRIGSGYNTAIDESSVCALYRTLASVGEVVHAGAISRQLQQICEALVNDTGDKRLAAVRLQHLVGLMAMAVGHHQMARKSMELMQSLSCVRDIVDGLCETLRVVWRPLWKQVFATRIDVDDGWAMQLMLVDALKSDIYLSKPVVPMCDRLAMAESALRELTIIQNVLLSADNIAERAGHYEDGYIDSLLLLARELVALVLALAKTPGIEQTVIERLVRVLLLPESATTDPAELELLFSVGKDEGSVSALYASCLDNQSQPAESGSGAGARIGTGAGAGIGNRSATDGQAELSMLLEGKLVSAFSNGSSGRNGIRKIDDSERLAHMTEQMLWQNAVRPLPKYPRSGMHRHSRADDAWTFARTKSSKPNVQTVSAKSSASSRRKRLRRPLLVYALLAVARQTASSMSVLGTILEEYYAESLPSLPPAMLDQRLGYGRQQMRSAEMELMQDMRKNPDLEHIVFQMMQSPNGRESSKRLVSALLAALIVLWSGALSEASRKRPDDLEFTVRLVDGVVAMAEDAGMDALSSVFPLVGGSDVARLLHVCVWRRIVHCMPGAEDESRRLLGHVLRRHLVDCAPLFKLFSLQS
ncbi:hypothetical protein J3B02_000764 [Coemansia erecta]|nr:hypothetical protein J3B02_000764 [Coemansia erecta]